MRTPEPKSCVNCGRTIEWRKKWERSWPEVKYCSDACRRHRLTDVDANLEAAIVELLEQRARGATICPSEAAKAVGGADGDWRALMERSRRAARRLVASGRVEITQRGSVVDPST